MIRENLLVKSAQDMGSTQGFKSQLDERKPLGKREASLLSKLLYGASAEPAMLSAHIGADCSP